ncbi:MAG: hypothetical protein EHM16_12355 [Betaproteobacteria bacterium]|nr:MAG: hypothetical protein EHM16_12355 [Betaproteobacteria bacterium]
MTTSIAATGKRHCLGGSSAVKATLLLFVVYRRAMCGKHVCRGKTGAKMMPDPLFHKVKYPPLGLMYLSNSPYAFFFRNMLLSNPRFTRVSGMWYLVAFGEIHLFH